MHGNRLMLNCKNPDGIVIVSDWTNSFSYFIGSSTLALTCYMNSLYRLRWKKENTNELGTSRHKHIQRDEWEINTNRR